MFHVFISFLFSKKASVTGVLFCLPKFNSNLGNDILSTIFGTQLHFSGAKSIVRLHFLEHYPTLPNITNLPMSAKCYKNAIS
jgi:hypothetical protein